MRHGRSFIFPALFFFCSTLITGCASHYEPTGYFASYALLEPGPYFKQEFVEPLANFEKYKKIKLMPVTLEYFDKESEYKLKPGDKERLLASLQSFLKNELAKTYEIVDRNATPDQQTLIVEPALVYARKPQRLINVISTLLIMVPLSSGSAAFEVKMMDAPTGKVVAQAAEKRTGAGGFKSLVFGPFMEFDHLEAIFKKWSENLAGFIAGQKFMAPPYHGEN